MKIEVNIEKKYAFMILGALLVLIAAIGVYAAVDKTTAWHDSHSVEVNISGSMMSLQEAIDSGNLTVAATCGNNQYSYFNGTNFVCRDDVDTTNGLVIGGGFQYWVGGDTEEWYCDNSDTWGVARCTASCTEGTKRWLHDGSSDSGGEKSTRPWLCLA